MKALFEPEIRLRKNSQGNLVLQATTPTPNSCHVAGETEISPPPPPFQLDPPGDEVSPLPGPRVMEVKLHIEETDSDICLPYVKPVHHCVQFAPPPHTTEIRAIVMLNGEKVQEELLPLNSSNPEPEEPNSIIGTEDFQAWVNLMSPGEPTLHVQGNVIFPDARYKAKLVKAENAQENDTLVLNLEVERREGIFPPVVTTRSVEYEQSGSKVEQFERVKVLLPSDKTINLKLRNVFSDNSNSNNTSSCRPKTSDDKEEFQAFLDLMPGSDPTLRVRGTVQVPNPGYEVELTCAVTKQNSEQGNTLVLQLKKEPPNPDDVGQPVVSICSVEYVALGSILRCFKPEQVKILQTGQEPIRVPVEEVF